VLFSSDALDTGSVGSGTAASEEADDEVDTQAEEASEEADDDMETEDGGEAVAIEDIVQVGGDLGELIREKNLVMAFGLDLLDDEDADTDTPLGVYVEEAAWSVVRR